MADRPSGTVTFLFTDIEGSTRLVQELGDAYPGMLAEHRRLLRAIFAAHDGYEVDTQGDAFMVAFARARDAVAVAEEVQRATAQADVRVRIGIHTAEAAATPEGYVGLGVHRAARICSAAHGGQVLVSQTTRDLLFETPGEHASLRDLGEQRLKDLTQAQRLYQLVAPELEAEFPPLRSLENRTTNLPLQPTPLVGRTREIAEVTGLLRRGDTRLVTLTGPGGTGKTRLAVQAAAELLDDFADGVFFVGLAGLADHELVMPTVARTIGLAESEASTLVGVLRDYVRSRELLLVLDNFEHVLGAAPAVGELIGDAEHLQVLATSRGRLNLAAEHLYPVPPLETPNGDLSADQLLHVDSVAIFVARARSVRPGFELTGENAPAVAEICTMLDGLPLALELAAARVAVLPPAKLLGRLDDRLRLLTGGPRDAPERHQALRAAIDWSYDLLDSDQQALFARLSVFAGTCALEAAEAVHGPDALDGLTSLIDKSLVRLEETADEPRFRMLRTIREYALERLRESGDEPSVRGRHLEHFLRLAERAYAERFATGFFKTLADLSPDLDNFRAAADWAAQVDPERELELVGALAWFWINVTTIDEAERRLSAALERSERESPARFRATQYLGQTAASRGNSAEAIPLYESALFGWREAGGAIEISLALEGLGDAHLNCGTYDLAERYLRESLELRESLGSPVLIRRSLARMCQLLVARGDVDRAEPLAEELERLAADASDAWAHASALHFHADCPLIRGDYPVARQRYTKAAAFAWENGIRQQCATEIHGLAMALAGLGSSEPALRLAAAASAEWERERERRGAMIAIEFWSRLLDELLGRARAALGPAAAAAAEAAGRELPFDLAVAEAVDS